jgi:hypothetical protein
MRPGLIDEGEFVNDCFKGVCIFIVLMLAYSSLSLVPGRGELFDLYTGEDIGKIEDTQVFIVVNTPMVFSRKKRELFVDTSVFLQKAQEVFHLSKAGIDNNWQRKFVYVGELESFKIEQ